MKKRPNSDCQSSFVIASCLKRDYKKACISEFLFLHSFCSLKVKCSHKLEDVCPVFLLHHYSSIAKRNGSSFCVPKQKLFILHTKGNQNQKLYIYWWNETWELMMFFSLLLPVIIISILFCECIPWGKVMHGEVQ